MFIFAFFFFLIGEKAQFERGIRAWYFRNHMPLHINSHAIKNDNNHCCFLNEDLLIL